ncbi:ArsR/SmtB family transcription factor [Levilactobacillus koreensis]|uniref:HTH arsR-type domain-containing protein n=1 Tax=Levilactobacillus koreensis TaxID=637971 RepID=A0AAC8UWK6_9LACO|nr:metalloregulator ArsR/SmtB family transcription factor [Levilactobacillus koreensis]AKP65252.1 hypothetical protein ABN16_09690 [Levilactobacillus koreensis]
MNYAAYAQVIKAMADENRLKIIDLLSCGTLCACEILENFDFTQPTLSHHMKVLQTAGIVSAVKKGRWQYYTLLPEFTTEFPEFIKQLLRDSHECVCHSDSSCSRPD